jgi:hypothetical protein
MLWRSLAVKVYYIEIRRHEEKPTNVIITTAAAVNDKKINRESSIECIFF